MGQTRRHRSRFAAPLLARDDDDRHTRRPAHAGASSNYPVFKGPATLYAGRHRFRADELEGARRGSLREEALPRAQQHRIDDQQDFIRKPVFEQRRRQRGATPQDEVGAVVGLDAADALDDVGSEGFERAPFETFRTVRSDVFRCPIDAVRHRAARRFWPGFRP